MSQSNEVFRIRRVSMFWRWLSLLLIAAPTILALILLTIAVNGADYPDLDLLIFVSLMAVFLRIVWAANAYRLITSIQLFDAHFILKKMGQKAVCCPYTGILTHNERLNYDNAETVNELTVYLANSWFAIRSKEFNEYAYLKKQFTQYGQPVPYRNVLTVLERNRLRWLIGGLVLLIGAAITLGFVMHNPADPNPARLVSVTDVVDRVSVSRNKNRPDGIVLSLRAFPDFTYYVSPGKFDVRITNLQSAITPKRPITLLIRQSELRKKLRRTEPLTFGDKYDDYSRIMVFGVTQGDSVNILTPEPVHEPTPTPSLACARSYSVSCCCYAGPAGFTLTGSRCSGAVRRVGIKYASLTDLPDRP